MKVKQTGSSIHHVAFLSQCPCNTSEVLPRAIEIDKCIDNNHVWYVTSCTAIVRESKSLRFFTQTADDRCGSVEMLMRLLDVMWKVEPSGSDLFGGWQQMSHGSSFTLTDESVFLGCVHRVVCLHSHCRPLDVYSVSLLWVSAHVFTPVSVLFYLFVSENTLCPECFVGEFSVLCYLSEFGSVFLNSDSFSHKVNKAALWETAPFMPDCCDNSALPPLPLLAASVCQDKQTSRQLSRGLGLLWRICQDSPPLRVGESCFSFGL